MKKQRFENWLRKIYTTQDEEISCSECFDLVSAYVELEFSGGNAATKLPQVAQHLRQCAACREEYEILHDLRQLDDASGSPSIDDLPNSSL
jgi:hypothetical protein